MTLQSLEEMGREFDRSKLIRSKLAVDNDQDEYL